MNIRQYREGDAPAMAKIFYETVHGINARDYTEEQLNAWTDGNIDLDEWHERFSTSLTIVAASGGDLIGFANLKGNTLDMLYISRYYQRLGIGGELVVQLELAARRRGIRRLVTYSSITARPFFLHIGWSVVRPNTVIRNGVALTNYLMERLLV